MYMPRKILKFGYMLQGTDICDPRKCWDEQRTLDIQVGVIFLVYSCL